MVKTAPMIMIMMKKVRKKEIAAYLPLKMETAMVKTTPTQIAFYLIQDLMRLIL